MTPPEFRGLSSSRATKITTTIQRALAFAGLDTSRGPLRQMTETIRRALNPRDSRPETTSDMDDVRDADPVAVAPQEPLPDAPVRREQVRSRPSGSFEAQSFSNAAGARMFKLYVPASRPSAPLPLIVMLHGCTQSATDFALGTRMNDLAEQHGFLVAYPEQPERANPSECWNWFDRNDQFRDSGEPALIAGIVREVMDRHEVDPKRVFVAGLSAGAAMAVVMGETYPELFAGVGSHSGLAYGSAHDIPSALAAMKGGRSGLPGLQAALGKASSLRARAAVPTIIFQGDRDHTVQPSNGSEIEYQARDAFQADPGGGQLSSRTETSSAASGHRYTRTVHADPLGRPRVESWVLHGAGHAWSGGDPSGSYTDSNGPDASAEMVRFFLGPASALPE
jgi:poly(hydroxyalkanoate) depolymerase family esterase